MNKSHAALLLVAAALAVGWLLTPKVSNDTAPAALVTEMPKISTRESQRAAPRTDFPPPEKNMPPALVATETDRPHAAAATPLIDRAPQGVSSPEPVPLESGVRTRHARPTSPPQPASSRPAANPAPATSTFVSLPDPAPVVVYQEIPVPRGEPVPAAIMDEGYGATAGQVQSLDDIAGEFLDNALASGPAAQADVQNWRDAARLADERYRSMFGIEAFNRWSIEAAKEALAEKPQR